MVTFFFATSLAPSSVKGMCGAVCYRPVSAFCGITLLCKLIIALHAQSREVFSSGGQVVLVGGDMV